MEALKIVNLSKEFKDKKKTIKAVNNISFEVLEGETFDLLGMNGASKSTTIKMATSLIKPDSGEINIYGHSLLKEENTCKKIINV